MNNIKKLLSILPIIYNNREIDILTPARIDEYINELRKEYYNKYSDFNYKTNIQKDKLQSIIYNFTVGYTLKIESPGDARLLLLDSKTKQIIGGITIFEKDNNSVIELAYFIKPEYQHKGEALNMIIHTINALKDSDINFKLFRLITQDCNEASIKIANKLNFKKVRDFKGVYTTNYVFELER